MLKIGIHHGPCIAVNMNERLDYFGSTVNIARAFRIFPAEVKWSFRNPFAMILKQFSFWNKTRFRIL